MREADVLSESKDPSEVGIFCAASGNSPRDVQRAGRTPCNVAGRICRLGVLRLRSCFASRTSYSAQDDRLKWRNWTSLEVHQPDPPGSHA
jgi:hypothetical protein